MPDNSTKSTAGLWSDRRPKVSVMVITYNHEKYIAQALDSVLEQKADFDFEINVIEDCSTDRTAAIVLEYVEKYPQIVKPYLNEKNIGFKVTQRNFVRGFRTLKGEYIAILEGDDYWSSPQKLQKQVDYLDAHPDFAICAHNTIKLYDDGSQDPHRFLYFGDQGDGTIDDVISLRMFFHTTGALYRNVFDGVPPRQYISPWSCDIFIMISHAAHGKIHHMDEDLAVYRAHAGGRFSTMNVLEGWIFNIGGLQRYNAWLGFRFMKAFARSIAKYCDVVLTEAGKGNVASLTKLQRLKYRLIRSVYSNIYNCLTLRQQLSRLLLLAYFWLSRMLLRAHFGLKRRSELTAKQETRGEPVKASLEFLSYLRLTIHDLMVGNSVGSAQNVIGWMLKKTVSEIRLPSIANFGPQSAEQGKSFNVQPNGKSAMWFQVTDRLPLQTVLIFGGRELAVGICDKVVTAEFPPRLTSKAGKIPVWLEADSAEGICISEPIYFSVTEATQVAAYGTRFPSVEVFGPQPVEHGKPFNVQLDGQSAMWMQLDTAPPSQTKLVFGGTVLSTTINDRIVTATIPSHLTAAPGKTAFWLQACDASGTRVSDTVYFEAV